jgi:hypothetical protein
MAAVQGFVSSVRDETLLSPVNTHSPAGSEEIHWLNRRNIQYALRTLDNQ